MNLKNEIKKKIEDFIKKNGNRPTKLLVTKDIENEFLLIEPYPDISLSPKEAFEKGIYGLKIFWDSAVFEVE
jgi:hypothetical protein